MAVVRGGRRSSAGKAMVGESTQICSRRKQKRLFASKESVPAGWRRQPPAPSPPPPPGGPLNDSAPLGGGGGSHTTPPPL